MLSQLSTSIHVLSDKCFQVIFGQSPMSLTLTVNTDSCPRNILFTLLRTRTLTCSSHSHKQQMTMPWVQTIYTCYRFPVYLMHFVPQGFIALKVSKKAINQSMLTLFRRLSLNVKVNDF